MAHTYSHLFGLPTTGLRFFTVYGPWGRPDMALFIFTKAMIENRAIDVYNYGRMSRDFTYVDDIVSGIQRLIGHVPSRNTRFTADTSGAPFQLFNIGFGNPVKLMAFIREIEKNLGIEAQKNMMEMQPGDVPKTWADIDDLKKAIDFEPKTSVEEGVKNFIDWYKTYYSVEQNTVNGS
jgi:UDP-glucuronate 4-epimerase